MTINPRKLVAVVGMLGVAGTAAVVAQSDPVPENPDPEVRPYKLPETRLRAPIDTPEVREVASGIEAFWASLTADDELNLLEDMEAEDFDPVGCYSLVEMFLPGQEEHFKTHIPAAGRVGYSQMCEEFKAGFHQAMLLQHMTGKKQSFAMASGTDVQYLKVEVRELEDTIRVTLVFPAVAADEGGTLIAGVSAK